MARSKSNTVSRKADHIEICLNEDVSFHEKTSGFEFYEFEHFAATELDYRQIDLGATFLNKQIDFPFMISCMTGGTGRARKINEDLAAAAAALNIAIGVGSQRQALENNEHHDTFRAVRKIAGSVPVLGNIGAAQITIRANHSKVRKLIDLIEADAIVIHLNPLQELMQPEGEPNFNGLTDSIKILSDKIDIPIIVKEVGAGISKNAAKKLLDAGAYGIDVAGAGGTSWSAVESFRSNITNNEYFRDWGLPTSFCLRKLKKLKKKNGFVLISSGGIDSGDKIAKSLVLGADIAASAGPIFKTVVSKGPDGVVEMIENWFDTVKKIMYLTSCRNIPDLQKIKLLKKRNLY